ncbi:3-hydroxybutyryl-CoA dehydrogenase [Corynebacterium sp. 3HC-13]|uniref:3-hydroxyacyl-CoA dehydrogenase family protein n=1 Tax=Corynebacterium poyangense TaxID=2684405 RepID=UPI001CCD6BA8|nr:3-hydroxyacyl-CoA dehydrogenase family protein [Corynebacterium poyangense]MBZ8177238.1 3-hydroxybutyryl-CoA dehydrogenase [Corynebacterium poyangense]
MSIDALPAKVGVLGGGRMGGGIAHAFLIKGCQVTVVDVSDNAAAAARERIERDVAGSLKRGLDISYDSCLDNLKVSCDMSSFHNCDLIIEAVPEDLQLKQDSFRKISAVAPEALLATNTSSLSVSDLALNAARPENVIGLHFFNPVPASKLVEIIVTHNTREELVAEARDWVKALDKTPVVVKDAPGFASSRLGVVIALEAMRMVEEGVASAEDIDAAMVLGYKFPIGPLALTDIVGLDVRLGIAEYLQETLGERFAPPAILRDKVEKGQLGRKTGQGFYSY